MQKSYLLILIVVFLLALLGWLQNDSNSVAEAPIPSQTKLEAPLFHNLKSVHYPVSTHSPLAQRFFNQGLTFFHGFNYAEAARSFREAARLDPKCAMCYWGLSLSLGSKNNAPQSGSERQESVAALKKAQQLADPKELKETALIQALAARFSIGGSGHEQEKKQPRVCGKRIVALDEEKAYAFAMKKVAEKYPTDIQILNLYAASLLDSSNWRLYDREGNPTPEGAELLSVIQAVFAIDPKSPPAHHYFIHVIEASGYPEKAMTSADFLSSATPGLEHLLHMPAHIYMLTGRYHDATLANQRAIAAHQEHVRESWGQGFQPSKQFLYHHNLHFLWASASMEGRSRLAIETADKLASETSPALAKVCGLESFYVIPYFALARFGHWNQLLELPKPAETFLFQTAIWHYVRGLAFLRQGSLDRANEELGILKEVERNDGKKYVLSKLARVEVELGIAVLSAEIASEEGNKEKMFTEWNKAVDLQESVGYREPPLWYFPIREGLAAAYMQWNLPKEAEEEYLEVLRQYPENGWALYGLQQSLLAQGRQREADPVEVRFKKAWSLSDISIPIQP